MTFPSTSLQTKTSGLSASVAAALKISLPLGCPHQLPRIRPPAMASARLGTGPWAAWRTTPWCLTNASAFFGVMATRVPPLEREVPFTLRLRPSELARIWPEIASLPEEEWVLVQGQIDALWPRPDGTRVVIDFKSDRVIGEAALRDRAASYRPQMRIYREAVARLWKPKRVEAIVYFLRAEQAVPLD